jgi:hypothetical protein
MEQLALAGCIIMSAGKFLDLVDVELCAGYSYLECRNFPIVADLIL